MRTFITTNRLFLLMYSLFLIVGGFFILKYERGDEIIYFNSLHTPFLDIFFKYVTHIAEMPGAVFIILLVTLTKYGKGLLLGINSLIVFLATILLKQVVFANQVRPAVFFEKQGITLNFVKGVDILRWHSFPSGHTSGAFAMFFMLSLLTENKKWSVVFFFIALLIGVSRIYLLEHFLRDVYFGSLLGVTLTTVFWLTFAQSRFYKGIPWKDKGLLK